MFDLSKEFMDSLPHRSNIKTKKQLEKNTSNSFTLKELETEYITTQERVLIILTSDLSKAEKITGLCDEFRNYFKKLNEANHVLKYSSQSKFESTAIEDLANIILCWRSFENVNEENRNKLHVGSTKAFIGMNLNTVTFEDFISGDIIANEKDQDASLYVCKVVKFDNKSLKINVPYISIECKTYLDKTMLEGSVATADKIKTFSPSANYFILTGQYAVKDEYDHNHHNINGIFVFCDVKKHNKSKGPLTVDPNVISKLIEKIDEAFVEKQADILKAGYYIDK